MSDGRINNGGKREGSGRPSKAEENDLIENIDRLIDRDDAILLMKEMMFEDRDFKALQMYMRYLYGVPVKKIETSIVEQPLFDL